MMLTVQLPDLDLTQCSLCWCVIHMSRLTEHYEDVHQPLQVIPPEPLVEATIEPEFEVTDRGFKRLMPIGGTMGGRIRVYESSNAMRPCVWVATDELDDLSGPVDGPVHTSRIELAIEDIVVLRDQLDWMVRNHYQAED